MIRIYELEINEYEAKGIVYTDQLTPFQLKSLGLNGEDEYGYCQEIEARIHYVIEWNDDVPMVTIKNVYLMNDNDSISLSDTEYDYDTLCIQLESDGPYSLWLEDKETANYNYNLYSYDEW